MTNKLAIYVHWPYCARICPYCDFNVYKNRDVDAARWISALTRDLHYCAARTPGGRISSLYFGGGTPSLAPIEVIESVISAASRLWGMEADAEITLEANPTDADAARFANFARAGVNRLSLGVQSLRDASLAFLGRDHDAASARRAIDAALAAFPRATFDLIYALPGQTPEDWAVELGEAIAAGVKHLSAYQLTIEPGTAFAHQAARGALSPLDDDACADLFELTQELTHAAGLPAYETSNHAAPGHQSAHNLVYWRQGDYIGVGPGAHGRLTVDGARWATETARTPSDYLATNEAGGRNAPPPERLSPEAQLVERLAMGLRLVEGIVLSPADRETLGGRVRRLSRLAGDGLVRIEGERLSATPAGARVLNAVVKEILA